MPQSMQRAPCSRRPSSASGSWYSAKSCRRSSIGRLRGSLRWILRKPPSSPMAGKHPLAGLARGLLAVAVLGGAVGSGGGVLVLARLARLARFLVSAGGHVRRLLVG